MNVFFFILILIIVVPTNSFSRGNRKIISYSESRDFLFHRVYYDYKITVYCGFDFDQDRNVALPEEFYTPRYMARASRVEVEHIIPAENFGRAFREWREGHPKCADQQGSPFRGRKCVELVSRQYRLMQADMYNLAPAVGAVNAMRQNFNYAMLPQTPPTFGSCAMKIDGRKVEPPDRAKGFVARAALYMDASYSPHYRLSSQQKRLFATWNRQFPVDKWECTRTKRIEKIQGNPNNFVKFPCLEAGLW